MEKSRWIAHERVKPEGKINLLCFTYPGGSASNFAPWKRNIDDRINLIPILYPEREVRKNDKMEESFELFIKDFMEENESLFAMPYAFFGYCGGAVLGYEIAVKAAGLYGKEPVWGFVASSEAPEYLKDSLVPFPEENAESDIVEYLLGLKIFDKSIVNNKIFLEYYIPMLKADCSMLDTYEYIKQGKLKCDFDVLYGKDDQTVRYEKTKQWTEVTKGSVKFEQREGGHFFVEAQKEYVCSLINERLSGWLENCGAGKI
ncbi:MAG: thioesterase domain-containing protein [Muricomes sp.]